MMTYITKNNILGFCKKFPAITYAILGLLATILIVNIELFGLLLIPFTPIILIHGGLYKVILVNSFFSHIVVTLAFLIILLGIDVLTLLIRRTLAKIFGYNHFTKVAGVLITMFCWVFVFTSLLNSLPIDT